MAKKDKGIIGGMVQLMVGIPLIGTAMGQVGTHMPGGIGAATQSMMGVGLLGHAASLSKKMFKW